MSILIGTSDEPRKLSQAEKARTAFDSMAATVETNVGAPFGGAFVIIPPENGGAIVSSLLIDANQDPAQFWAMLKTKCEIALADLADAQRAQQAFRR